MVLPNKSTQISLALMSRGERLQYAIIGEYNKVLVNPEATPEELPLSPIAQQSDEEISHRHQQRMIHREGTWTGKVKVLDRHLNEAGYREITEQVHIKNVPTATVDQQMIHIKLTGSSFLHTNTQYTMCTDHELAWSTEGDTVGSYSLYGGRALSGHLHDLKSEIHLKFVDDFTVGEAIKLTKELAKIPIRILSQNLKL